LEKIERLLVMAENYTEEVLDQETAETAEAAEELVEETAEASEETAEPVEEVDETADSEETDADPEKTAEKKSFFKKKKDKKDEQIEELNDRLKRNLAEFENFRKRTEKEKAAMFEVGAKSIVEKILPVVDNFERGLATVSEEQMEDAFVQGMDKTYKGLIQILEGLEVKPIPAVGEEFNPEYHSAVMHVEDDSVGDNVVVEEFQKGYTYRGSVVRFSMVKVAN